MRRREFIAALGGAAAWPMVARGQQRIARIGYLAFSSATQSAIFSNAFREGLRELGYVEGKNLLIESRYADGDSDRLPGLATDSVGLNLDVIVTYATGVTAAQHATSTIPIVMATYADAVAVGVVSSVAHPGPKHPPGPPMTFGNMRELGVRYLIGFCLNDACRHD